MLRVAILAVLVAIAACGDSVSAPQLLPPAPQPFGRFEMIGCRVPGGPCVTGGSNRRAYDSASVTLQPGWTAVVAVREVDTETIAVIRVFISHSQTTGTWWMSGDTVHVGSSLFVWNGGDTLRSPSMLNDLDDWSIWVRRGS